MPKQRLAGEKMPKPAKHLRDAAATDIRQIDFHPIIEDIDPQIDEDLTEGSGQYDAAPEAIIEPDLQDIDMSADWNRIQAEKDELVLFGVNAIDDEVPFVEDIDAITEAEIFMHEYPRLAENSGLVREMIEKGLHVPSGSTVVEEAPFLPPSPAL